MFFSLFTKLDLQTVKINKIIIVCVSNVTLALCEMNITATG